MARTLQISVTVMVGFLAASMMTLGADLTVPGLTVRLPENHEAEPGELVSYGFVLINTGARPLDLHVSFKSSPDWPLLGEAGPIHLEAGEETVVAVSVFVPAEALAGTEHRLELILTGRDLPLTATVVTRVKKRHGLSLSGPPAVTAPPGGEVVLPFLLANRGNADDTFRLQVTSANGWQVHLSSASVTVPPGETATVECRLKIPGWASPGLTEEVTLTAISAATGAQAQAKARIKIGPPVGDGRIMVGEEEFHLVGDFGFSFLSPPSPAEPPQVWLHATGSAKPGQRLEVLLAGEGKENLPALTDYFFLYRENNYEIKVGDFPSTWPGLVLPGTGRMELDASSSLGHGRWRLMLGREEETGNASWYAVAWTGQWQRWHGGLSLLATKSGINRSDAPYLELTADRYLAGTFFTAHLAMEAKEGGRSAGYLQYSIPANPLGWEAGLSWSDGINQANSLLTFSLGGTYNPASGLKAGLTFFQTAATATVTQAAYLARQADLRLRLGPHTALFLTAKGVWEEDFAWELGQTYYLGKFSYQNQRPGSLLELETYLSSTEEIKDHAPPQYSLAFSGRYRLAPHNSTGVWEARLEGGVAKSGPLKDWDLNTGKLRIGYEDKLSWPRIDGSYRLALAYAVAPVSAKGLAAEAAFNWWLGSDTRLAAEISASPAEFMLRLETVHRFGIGLPRPHATITGLIFQDLDDNGEPGSEEPGLAGLWLVLDGKRVGQSGPDGWWSLFGVKPGVHSVGVEAGEDPTLRPKSGPIVLEVRAGETREVFFPVWRLTTLTGCLFLDRDGDSFLGEGDEVLPGFSLVLARPDGGTETATTARDGTFLFADLPPGIYELRVEIPSLFEEEIEAPAPAMLHIEQQGHLTWDLALKPKEKPIVITYIEPPQVKVDLLPERVEPGGSFALTVTCETPMTKIRLEIPGAPPEEIAVSGTEWEGSFTVPPDRPPGPMEIGLWVWWSDGEEPVHLKAEMEVREPLRLAAAAEPARVGPGAKVTVSLTANRQLEAARLLLPWGEMIFLDCREEKAFGEVVLPENLLAGGDYAFDFLARDETGLEGKAETKIFLDPALLLVALRLYPFDVGSAAIKEEFKPVLARVAAILRANPGLRLLIIGHADATGKKEINEALSLQRAEAVKKSLVEDYGIAPTRLEVAGKGSREPVGDNATPEGRALNRRVEFRAAETEN